MFEVRRLLTFVLIVPIQTRCTVCKYNRIVERPSPWFLTVYYCSHATNFCCITAHYISTNCIKVMTRGCGPRRPTDHQGNQPKPAFSPFVGPIDLVSPTCREKSHRTGAGFTIMHLRSYICIMAPFFATKMPRI